MSLTTSNEFYSKTQNLGSPSVPFAVVEAYKTIRTNIRYAMSTTNNRSIIIASPSQGDGKTTTAVNIAIAFSQLGNRVLLIDADMRAPSVHRKVRIPNNKGLSGVLVGFNTFEESVVSVSSNLDVLVAGQIPPNPSELLSSERMSELLNNVNSIYDCVIIDTPPINVVSDTVALTSKTAGVVMVLHCKTTTYEQFEKAKASVEFANSKLLGVIINGSKNDEKEKHSHYYGVNNEG